MKSSAHTPLLDRFIAWSLDNPVPPPVRYLLATILIVTIALVRATFITSLLPWLLFIPAIMLIALAFGQGPGLYATATAAVMAGFSIAFPGERWWLTPQQWGGSIFFVLIAGGLVQLAVGLRDSFRRARRLNAELDERQAFLASVLASSTDCIKVMTLDGRLNFMSEGGMKVMEVSDFNAINGCPWPDFWQGGGNAEARAAIDRARDGQTSHFVGKADTFAGNSKWWDVSVSPILGADGKPAQILSVSRDTTALMEAQEQQNLLNAELGHRLKNVLALVQSIANQTFRQASSIEAGTAAFASRLVALGKATDVLTSTAWQSATLEDVIRAGLASMDVTGDRIILAGPSVRLDAQVALALTLTLHELATNARKYGALSNEDGMVTLTWNHRPVENGGDGRFFLAWRESGGPPVTPPSHRGFGSKMIERSLQSYFRGETLLSFPPEGVTFTIDAPLPVSATHMSEQA